VGSSRGGGVVLMQGCRGIRQPCVGARMCESDFSMQHLSSAGGIFTQWLLVGRGIAEYQSARSQRSQIGRRGVKTFIAAEAHRYSLSKRGSGRRSPSAKYPYFQTCFVSHEYMLHAASSSSSSPGGAKVPPCCAIIKAVNSAILALKSFT
jgi:hypothetical protein